MSYVRQANVAIDTDKWIHRSYLHQLKSQSSSKGDDVLQRAHDRAVARLTELLGDELGCVPRNVGDIHIPLHLRARRMDEIRLSWEGGPQKYSPQTEAVCNSRYRPGARSSNRAPPFSTALRWGTVCEREQSYQVMEAMGKSTEMRNKQGRGELEDWSEVEILEKKPPAKPGRIIDEESDLDNGLDWDDIEIMGQKENLVSALKRDDNMVKLSQRLRLLGRQRALEKIIYGEAKSKLPDHPQSHVVEKLIWRH